MSAGSKAINYLSMILGAAVGLIVGLIIYRRTMARAEELARQEGLEPTDLSAEEGEAGYADSGNTMLMDPEDAAVLMSDDDISLWGRDGTDSRYHDDDDDDDDEEDEGNTNKRRDRRV